MNSTSKTLARGGICAQARTFARNLARPRVRTRNRTAASAAAFANTHILARNRTAAGAAAHARNRARIFAFALVLASTAFLLAGCSGSSSDVPGHYSISEQSISASEASPPHPKARRSSCR